LRVTMACGSGYGGPDSIRRRTSASPALPGLMVHQLSTHQVAPAAAHAAGSGGSSRTNSPVLRRGRQKCRPADVWLVGGLPWGGAQPLSRPCRRTARSLPAGRTVRRRRARPRAPRWTAGESRQAARGSGRCPSKCRTPPGIPRGSRRPRDRLQRRTEVREGKPGPAPRWQHPGRAAGSRQRTRQRRIPRRLRQAQPPSGRTAVPQRPGGSAGRRSSRQPLLREASPFPQSQGRGRQPSAEAR
jgi:hypothetical protein